MNIITRTSNRPKYFHECVMSIMKQTCSNKVIHHITYDNKETLEYIMKELGEGKRDYEVRLYNCEGVKKKGMKYWYNLYCNKVLKNITGGWIMYLDDDDVLSHEFVLETIFSYIDYYGCDKIYVSQVKFPHKILPIKHFAKPMLGQFPSCSFCYHSKYKECLWKSEGGSDFLVLIQVFKLCPYFVFIDHVLSKIGYTNDTGGKGKQIDKK